MFHGILNRPHIHDSYTVTFAEQPSFNFLDNCEDKWLIKPNALIDIKVRFSLV